ncbi:MAG: coenzyme A pyrophosphatase, partial [Bacteroidetes bacterium]
LPPNRKATDFNALNQDQIKKAAVLVLIENNNNQPQVVLILRTTYKGTHSGQVSFPGGKREKEDVDFLDTALRESEEEIGISRNDLQVLGALSPIYIPPSNFLVYPFVAISHKVLDKVPEEKEVAGIYTLALDQLFASDTLRETEISSGSGIKVKVPAFHISDLKIWGATAMMLCELKYILKK